MGAMKTAVPADRGGSSNPVYAAFWHTALVRYVDFMDNFLAPTETCHSADNFGSVLTAAEYAGASGSVPFHGSVDSRGYGGVHLPLTAHGLTRRAGVWPPRGRLGMSTGASFEPKIT